MLCRICQHSESRVVRTSHRDDALIRVRRCRQCGHDWQTVEQSREAMEATHGVVAKARELAGLVNELPK